MKNHAINTPFAPQAIGPYSQAMWAGATLHLSGQIALDPAGSFQNSDFETELRQIFSNIHAILHAAHGNFSHLRQLTIYVLDFTQFQLLNNIMAELLPTPYPARTTIAVSALPKGARVEIAATAYFSDKHSH